MQSTTVFCYTLVVVLTAREHVQEKSPIMASSTLIGIIVAVCACAVVMIVLVMLLVR